MGGYGKSSGGDGGGKGSSPYGGKGDLYRQALQRAAQSSGARYPRRMPADFWEEKKEEEAEEKKEEEAEEAAAFWAQWW